MRRSLLLSGFALLAGFAAFSAAPANADPLQPGGIAITRGGHNFNVARGAFSGADQAITTLGGVASGHGRAITNGGNNRNTALGKFSFAGQDVTTVGGIASGARQRPDQRRQQPQHRPRLRQHSPAERHNPGRHRHRPCPVHHAWRQQRQPRGRQVLLRRPAGPDHRRHRLGPRQEPRLRRQQPQRRPGLRLLRHPAGRHRRAVTIPPSRPPIRTGAASLFPSNRWSVS